MARKKRQKDDFYPCVIRTDPPRVVTRGEIDMYFQVRGTVVRTIHIPATAPREERIDAHRE
jgi:hypothetical protein